MTTILKIGGSEVTDKRKAVEPKGDLHSTVEAYFRRADVERYARELMEGLDGGRDIILIHGAGASAHYELEVAYPTHKSPQRVIEAASYTSKLFCETLEDCGFKVRRHEPAELVTNMEKGIEWAKLMREFDNDIADGVIPVAHGTLVRSGVGGPYDGYVVLSGDVVPIQAAVHKKQRTLFFTSDQRGIYDRNPSEPGAVLLRRITPSEDVGKYSIRGREADVSGGPLGKARLLQAAVREHGITSHIFSAMEHGNIREVLQGNLEVVGTTICQ